MAQYGSLFFFLKSSHCLSFFSVICSKAVISSVALNLVYSSSLNTLTFGGFRGVLNVSRTAEEGRLIVLWDSGIMLGTGFISCRSFKRFGALTMTSEVKCL